MSRIQKLKIAEIPESAIVVLRYIDGSNVNRDHDYENDVIESTYIANHLSEMVINPCLENNNILKEMRDCGLLDDYEKGTFEFESYVAEVIKDNWRKYGWIDADLTKHGYKKGYAKVSASLTTTASSIYQMADFELSGWEIIIKDSSDILYLGS